MSAPPLWLAVHEAGHAVAHQVLDELPPYPGPHIISVSVKPDAADGSLGRVSGRRRTSTLRTPPHTKPVPAAHPEVLADMRRQARYDIVELLAGRMAESYQRGGPYCPLRWTDEIVSKTINGDPDAGGDMSFVRKTLDWLELPDPAAELKRLWRITYGLIASEWPGIVRIARILRERRFMGGEDFEAEWRAGRSTPAMRQRLEKRLGDGLAGWRDGLVGAAQVWA